MLSIEKKKSIQKGGKELELDADQLIFQKKLATGAQKDKRDIIDNKIFNLNQDLEAERT